MKVKLNATRRLIAARSSAIPVTASESPSEQERLNSLYQELNKVGLNVRLVTKAGRIQAIEAYPVGALNVTKALLKLGWRETSDKSGSSTIRHFAYKDGSWPLVVKWGGASYIYFEDSTPETLS
jgi:hypothetical protein